MQNTKFGADESAEIMTWKLCRKEAFSYWRFGDGFIELLMGKKGGTCDGEKYTTLLAGALAPAVCELIDRHQEGCYFGDWQSASFSGPKDPARYTDAYQKVFSAVPEERWLHFEALLFMRASKALADFYRALREDPRRKVYVGPAANAPAAASLGCACVPTPMTGLMERLGWISERLHELSPQILVFGAGMAGNIPAIKYHMEYPGATVINLGSALDILGRGRSRKQQIPEAQARAVFEGRI